MSKITWHVEERDIKDLIPADYNPRKLSADERRDLENSIQEFGEVVPVVVNVGKRKDVLIGGHQRTTLYADLKKKKVKVMVPSRELTLDEEKRLNLRLNKNTGSWDFEKLAEMELETLIEVGFGDEELSTLWDDVDMMNDNFDVERARKEIKTPKARPGYIYQLGSHRVMCGDSTDLDQMSNLMQGKLADVVYIDPPKEKVRKKKDAEQESLLEVVVENTIEFAAPNAHMFCWTDEKGIASTSVVLRAFGVAVQNVCMWIKQSVNMNPKVAFSNVYQPCVYGTRGKPKLNKMHSKVSGILNKEVDADNQLQEDVLGIVPLWLDRHDDTKEHPDQKPVTLCERPLKRTSSPGDTILDPFGGSGSLLVACEQIGRTACVMEKDPVYVDVIIKRWEAFTNRKAKRA